MKLTPGQRLASQVCATEVIVVRGAELSDDLTCGGCPMIPWAADRAISGEIDTALAGGTELGKRYAHDSGLELIVSSGGAGTLAIGREPIGLKEAKPLPASD